MKASKRREYLQGRVDSRWPCLSKLVQFIRSNSGVNEEYQVRRLKRAIAGIESSYDRTIFILRDCMNSSSNPSLSQIGSTIKSLYNFYDKLEYQRNSRKVPFIEIIGEVTGTDIDTMESLHNAMKNLSGVGDKISALILRNLYYAISHEVIHVSKWPNDYSNLKVAVDIVICESLNRLLQLENSAYRFEPSKDFGFLNEIFKKILTKNEALLMFEDLWFWGYYNQHTIDKIRKHNCLNYDKIYAEQWVQPKELLQVLLDKSEEYRRIINSCDA